MLLSTEEISLNCPFTVNQSPIYVMVLIIFVISHHRHAEHPVTLQAKIIKGFYGVRNAVHAGKFVSLDPQLDFTKHNHMIYCMKYYLFIVFINNNIHTLMFSIIRHTCIIILPIIKGAVCNL